MVYGYPQYGGKDRWLTKADLNDGALISEGTISLQSESHPVEFRKVTLFNLSKYMQNPKKLQQVLDQLKRRGIN